jgi:filamentous hemagglutinin family protein
MLTKKTSLSYVIISCILASSSGASAQNVVPSSVNGFNTDVTQVGNQYSITGGTQAGANLFHSLQKLGLSTGEIANFLSNSSIQNILTRITGGEASLINGLIQVTGGESNLFIMNPAGIIFGSNASLNVPANFSASTASAIKVGNGWFGINSSVDQVRNLTGIPTGYAFSSILPNLDSTQFGVILNEGNLSVNNGKSVTLIGGKVVNTGTIFTPDGKITIAATDDNKFIKITNEGRVLSLELAIDDRAAIGNAQVLRGVDLPSLLTGSGITPSTQTGMAIVKGQLSASNIDILANRYDTSQASLNTTKIQQGWNYVFIDANVKNYQTLVNGTTGGANVNVIEANQNGISKISQTLANVTGANSLHIVSEGDKGNFWVGKDFVNNDRLSFYASDFSAWKLALSTAAEVMLYACNLAGDSSGQALVQRIASFTGSPVAASIDRTGAASSNANWNLEYSSSAVRPHTLFTSVTQQNYADALATLTATNNNDLGAGSLRQSIINALAGDTIAFDPSVTLITLASTLGINKNLTINGDGKVTVSGNNAVRVFDIVNNITVNLNGVTVANGRNAVQGGGAQINAGSTLNINNSTFSNNSANTGGAIYNQGTATITNSTFSSNSANFGGAITNQGIATITNSTFSGNSSQNEGGAIYNFANTATIRNSTFFGNSANSSGGAIVNFGSMGGNGTVTIANSILVGNIAAVNGREIFNDSILNFTDTNVVGSNGTNGISNGTNGLVTGASIIPTGAASNVINTTLANNGGLTQTHALVSGSIAINAGSGLLTSFDQRGVPASGIRDIGAFEFLLPVPPSTIPPSTKLKPKIDPVKEVRRDRERNLLTLRRSTPVAFLSFEDIEFRKFDRFLLIIVNLMNQDGGDLTIKADDIWEDTNMSIFDQPVNQKVIREYIRRSIGKFIGSEYIKLVNISFEAKNNKRNILINVRKSPKPVKVSKN